MSILTGGAQDSKYKQRLEQWADDVSCALFSLANVVTIMYYIVDTSTNVRDSYPDSTDSGSLNSVESHKRVVRYGSKSTKQRQQCRY